MEVPGCHFFLFWHRTMISTVSWHEDKSPSCHETSKHMPHLPKQRVIAAWNPKNGHFDNNLLKSLQFKRGSVPPRRATYLLWGIIQAFLKRFWSDLQEILRIYGFEGDVAGEGECAGECSHASGESNSKRLAGWMRFDVLCFVDVHSDQCSCTAVESEKDETKDTFCLR